MKKKILLLLIFCGSCKERNQFNEIQYLITSDSSKVWDWDTDDICENIYPCVGIVFYTNHTLTTFRYFPNQVDTTTLLRHINPTWSCLQEEQTWRVLNDTTLIYKGDTCRIIYISSDTLIISLKVNNYSEDNIVKYIKPHKTSIPIIK